MKYLSLTTMTVVALAGCVTTGSPTISNLTAKSWLVDTGSIGFVSPRAAKRRMTHEAVMEGKRRGCAFVKRTNSYRMRPKHGVYECSSRGINVEEFIALSRLKN